MHNNMIDSALSRSEERVTKHGHEGVIKELVSNSWDAIRARLQTDPAHVGRVHVTYAREDATGEATIIVADNGSGMDRDTIKRPYDMTFHYDPPGNASKGGKFNVGSKSWMAIAHTCTYITRSSLSDPWIGATASESDIDEAKRLGLDRIQSRELSRVEIERRMHELSASFDFAQTLKDRRDGTRPEQFCPIGDQDFKDGIGTIVIYEGVGRKGLYSKGAPSPAGKQMVTLTSAKLGTHFARPINDGRLLIDFAHLSLSAGRLKDPVGPRDDAHRRVMGVSQIKDLAAICAPEPTQVVVLPGGEVVKVTGWICDQESQSILKQKDGSAAGIVRTEVIRPMGSVTKDSAGFGKKNPRFARWQSGQGIDIIRNGEYVHTVRLPGFDVPHNNDNYWRIEVEYEAGTETDRAIQITSDRQDASIESEQVSVTCMAMYRAVRERQWEVSEVVRAKNAAAAPPPARVARGELEAKIEEQGEQIRQLQTSLSSLMEIMRGQLSAK
jgi:hypothetical protein